MMLTLDDRVQRAVIWAIRLSLITAVGLEIFLNSWQLLFISVLALVLSFIPTLIERRYNIDLPIEFEIIIIVFVYSSMFLGDVLNFYSKFWWWDGMLHTVSGIVLGFWGFLILYLLYYRGKLLAKPATIAIFSFCFALAGGALWEILEYSSDKLLGTNMQKSGLPDTMWDLIVDAAGALLVSFIGYLYLQEPTRGPFHRFITNFLHLNPRLKSRGKNG